MPAFTPPTVDDVPRVTADTPHNSPQYRFARHLSPLPRGRTVLRRNGVISTVDNPPNEWLTGVEGVDYWLGGHLYTVTTAVGAELAAAGYDVTADPVPPFGAATWGAVRDEDLWLGLVGQTWLDLRTP